MTERDSSDHVAANRQYWDEAAAAGHGPLARGHWSAPEPRWGLWATPESRAGVFPDDVAGLRAIELGCGTGYVSAWLARAGARPVGMDVSARQLATARAMQDEFGFEFPLLLGDAERVPCRDGTFDLAISEYGAPCGAIPTGGSRKPRGCWCPAASLYSCAGHRCSRCAHRRPAAQYRRCWSGRSSGWTG